MSAAASACAGLGLFFTGIRLIASHLRELASGGIRRLLSKTFQHPAIAPLAGLVAGALTQSTSAVTFITTGLLSAGAISLSVAVSTLAWANVGTSVLVLLASLDVHALALYLLALIGLAFFNGLDQSEQFRHITYALFGLALLLLGLTLVKAAVAEVNNEFWVREFVAFAASGAPVSLLAGFVLAIALQSSSIVTVLALPLAAEGLVDLHAMTLLILGACAGSGTAVILVSSGLEGPTRQLSMTQGMVRGVASLLLLPFVLIESRSQDFGLAPRAATLTTHLPTQVGIVFLVVQIGGVVVAKLLRRPILMLAAWAAPPSPAEALSRSAYLYDEAIADPGTALELIRLEQVRQLQALPDYLEDLRDPQERNPDAPPLNTRAAASAAVAEQMDEFLSELLAANPDMSSEHVFDVRRRLGDLKAVQKTLAEFSAGLAAVPHEERSRFTHSLVEGLHALLVVVGEASADPSPDTKLFLAELTAERGPLIDRVRRELLEGSTTAKGREAVLSTVLLLERLLWMLRERSPLPPGEKEKEGDKSEADMQFPADNGFAS